MNLNIDECDLISESLYMMEEAAEGNQDNETADRAAILNRRVRIHGGLEPDERLNAIDKRGVQA